MYKARKFDNKEDLTIEMAKERNESTLIQEGTKIVIHTDSEGSTRYESLLNNLPGLQDKDIEILIAY